MKTIQELLAEINKDLDKENGLKKNQTLQTRKKIRILTDYMRGYIPLDEYLAMKNYKKILEIKIPQDKRPLKQTKLK